MSDNTLPIVAWLHELTTETYREASITSFSETDPWVDALRDVGHAVLSRSLTPHAPAQAAANERDELRAEVETLKAKQIDVEAVMRLAEVYAKASSELDESIRSRSRAPRMVNRHDLRVHVAFKAAHEALRASLLDDGGAT